MVLSWHKHSSQFYEWEVRVMHCSFRSSTPLPRQLHSFMILADLLHLSWSLAALPLVLSVSLPLFSRQDIRSYYCSSPSVRRSNHSTGSATSELQTSKELPKKTSQGAQISSRTLNNVAMFLVRIINSPSSNSFVGAFLALQPPIRSP